MWGTGDDNKKKLASSRKRNHRYVANIFVISDPKNPETEGKVFLFTFGTKIFQMLKSCVNPEFEDQPKFNPFNMWKGANFRMKMKPIKKQRSYDLSTFDKCGPLADDATIEKIYSQLYSLDEFLDPTTFKSYDELIKKFNDITDSSATMNHSTNDEFNEFETKDSVGGETTSTDKYKSFLSKLKEPSDEEGDGLPF